MQFLRAPSLILALAAAGVIASPRSANAKQSKYVGGHPIHDKEYCYIQAPHVHVYSPAQGDKQQRRLLYRNYDDHYHFVGDPVAHGYDGPHYAYYGHHPIAVDAVVGVHVEGQPHDLEFCYLDGPHYHYYEPAPELKFEVKGGLRWYVGAFPPAYKKRKRALVRVNAYYEPVVYERPVVEVGPPAGYVGAVVEVRGPEVTAEVPVVEVEAPAAEVRAGVEVHIPTPTLEVEVGLPGVVVVDDHHHGPPHRHKKYKRKKHKKHKKHKYFRKHRRKHERKRKHRGRH